MPRYPWMRSLIILHNASIDKTTTRHVGVGRNNWNKKNMQNLCRRSAVLGKESQGESRLPAPCNEPTKRRYCEIFKIEFFFLKQKNSLDATLRRTLVEKRARHGLPLSARPLMERENTRQRVPLIFTPRNPQCDHYSSFINNNLHSLRVI